MRGDNSKTTMWDDFSGAFLDHFLPQELRKAKAENFGNLKVSTVANKVLVTISSAPAPKGSTSEIDFRIDLLSDTHPISIPPYKMSPNELKKLKEQLKYLLDKVMSFGLTNVPTAFMDLMNRVFRHFMDLFVLDFIDNILVYSKSEEDHANYLRIVLQNLKDQKFEGIKVDSQKVEAAKKYPRPMTPTDIRSFLGLFGYYRRFVGSFLSIATPLMRLTQRKVKLLWSDACEGSFEKLKDKLTFMPVLTLAEGTDGFVRYCDVSCMGLGFVLMHHGKVVAYTSRQLNIKDGVGQQKVMAFEIGRDGTLRYQGRLCVPDVDGLRERILTGALESRNTVHMRLPRSRSQYNLIWVIMDRMTKSAHFLPVTTNYSGEDYAKLFIQRIVKLHRASFGYHLPPIEFAYNNSYHSSIQMAPFEALYGRRCRSPIRWIKVGETRLFGPNLVHQAIEKVKVIREKIKTAQSYQKSYADMRQRELEFKVSDWVFLKVSSMIGFMRFG
ncbi:putative CST complex subunit CTC1-like [Capsicum annuum]|nr:putative CST complex subunit CTC1-like [Capsicum annuum]